MPFQTRTQGRKRTRNRFHNDNSSRLPQRWARSMPFYFGTAEARAALARFRRSTITCKFSPLRRPQLMHRMVRRASTSFGAIQASDREESLLLTSPILRHRGLTSTPFFACALTNSTSGPSPVLPFPGSNSVRSGARRLCAKTLAGVAAAPNARDQKQSHSGHATAVSKGQTRHCEG